MLVIRLTRTGKTSQESFRMVVAEKSKAVKRQYIELVGHYVPTVKPKILKFNKDRIIYWISKGAKPTETVASILKSEGMPDMDKYIHFKMDRKAKKKKRGNEPESTENVSEPESQVNTSQPTDEKAEDVAEKEASAE